MNKFKPLAFTEEEEAKIKAKLVFEVSKDIDFIKKQLFAPCRSIARNKRRNDQPWLRKLKTGG